MRVGLDTFSIRELKLDAYKQLDFIKAHGMEGAQFGGLGGFSKTLDPGEIRAVREYADSLGLYSHVSVTSPNPCMNFGFGGSPDERRDNIARNIELAAQFGWHELHTVFGGPSERYEHPTPWTQQLAEATEMVRSLGPVLREHGSRIDIETHAEITTFELVRLIEDVGPEIAGICLDTGNVVLFGEDPVDAARRAAPYTHLTHTKDVIWFLTDIGIRRQGRAPGEGALDWEQILPILGEYSPDLPLSIEDHKWLFDAPVFTEEWNALQPDLSRAELAKVIGTGWEWQRKIQNGECPVPEEYEAIPYLEQLEHRLSFGSGYLKDTLVRLGVKT